MSPRHLRSALSVLLLSCAFAARGGADPVPDFALEDVNPSSASFGDSVGPADYRGSVTAWYFGRST